MWVQRRCQGKRLKSGSRATATVPHRTMWRTRALLTDDSRCEWLRGRAPTRLVSRVQRIGVIMEKSDELKDRIEAKRHELMAKLHELKADTRHEATEQRAKLQSKLGQLEKHLKEGWDKMSDAVRIKLDKWLEHDK
jgi:hypothetical protein